MTEHSKHTSSARRRWFSVAIKAAISAGLMWWVLRSMDFILLWSMARAMDIRWFLLSLAVFFVSIPVRSLKWMVMLRWRGIPISLGLCMGYYWIGTFWNMFLPTRVGGDVVKMLLIRNKVGWEDRTDTVVSVLTDRLTNFVGLVLIGCVTLLFVFPAGLGTAAVTAAVILASVISVIAMRRGLFSRLAGAILPRFAGARAVWIQRSIEAFEGQLSDWRNTTVYVLAGTIIQIIMVLNTSTIGKALGVPMSFSQYLLSVSAVGIVSLLPITINGLGLREGAFVKITGLWGLPPEQAFAVSFLTFFMAVLGSLPGGILYVMMNHSRQEQDTGKDGEGETR